MSAVDEQLQSILKLVQSSPEGLSRGQIAETLNLKINNKTLQRRLFKLVEQGQITKKGAKKGTKYFPALEKNQQLTAPTFRQPYDIFSNKSKATLGFLEEPLHTRAFVSYKRDFLENYVPNSTFYVPINQQQRLAEEGMRFDAELAAGTYARKISQRLLIDLSYNSSRLEGNTYSKLDTQRLVEEGITAEGKVHEETVMIMNHKEALLFIIENAQHIELDSFTIRNLHYLLAQDLLINQDDCGRIRTIDVDIGKSTYKPINNAHILNELLELILLKSRKINHPFEQSFFLLVHLSYLRAFVDVNKRTSRLACNIPFIKSNLCPLSFTDVTSEDYTAALLTLYEKNDTGPMLDLFCWAYSRSCRQYDVVKESIGEVDSFRIKYRKQRKDVMGKIIRLGLHGQAIDSFIADYCDGHSIENIDKFTAITLADLNSLHAGAIVGLGITPKQLEDWKNGH